MLNIDDATDNVPVTVAPGTAPARDENRVSYDFSFDPSRQYAILTQRESLELLTKWGIDPRQCATNFSLSQYTFDNVFSRANVTEFLLDLFNSPSFRGNFLLGDGKGGCGQFWGPPKVSSVDFTVLHATATSMDLFNPLLNGEIVHADSHRIMGMMDEYLPGGVTVGDRLRGLFMIGSDNDRPGYRYPDDEDVVPQKDRQEFLWHVMWRLVAGGAMNQYEESYDVYRDVCRDLYKELISVAKDPSNGALSVQSVVIQVHAARGSGNGDEVLLFPRDDDVKRNHNYMYVIVQPARRSVTLWYSSFWSAF